jgi:hypothetical protein
MTRSPIPILCAIVLLLPIGASMSLAQATKMTTAPSTSEAASTTVPHPITDVTKDALEKQKLTLEIEALSRPWHQQTQTYINLGTMILAIVGAYITIRFQAHQSDLKIARAEIDTKMATLATEQAKLAHQRAEVDRDKAISDARLAELRVNSAKTEELASVKRMEEAKAILTKMVANRSTYGWHSPERVAAYMDDLMDVVFATSIQPLSKPGSLPKFTDGPQTFRFDSAQKGTEVWLKPLSLMHDGTYYDSPMDGPDHTKYADKIGVTPCTVAVPSGAYRVTFADKVGAISSRHLEVNLTDGMGPAAEFGDVNGRGEPIAPKK